MDDEANSRASQRSRLGLTRELQQERTDDPPHPGMGGANGYPVWYREKVLAHAQQHGIQAAVIVWL